MRSAYVMLPKYICAASSGHVHACPYTQIALDLMHSLNGAYPNRLLKSVYAFTTSADHLIDSHVVISEDTGKRLRSLIRKWASERYLHIRWSAETRLFISFFMIEAYAIGLLCSTGVALVLQERPKTCLCSLIRNTFQNDCLLIILHGVSAEWHREKR